MRVFTWSIIMLLDASTPWWFRFESQRTRWWLEPFGKSSEVPKMKKRLGSLVLMATSSLYKVNDGTKDWNVLRDAQL